MLHSISAVFYSIFALVPFGKLVIADVLFFTLSPFFWNLAHSSGSVARNLLCAAHSEFQQAALEWLSSRRFQWPFSPADRHLFRDHEYGLPAVIGASVAVALGPIVYTFARARPPGHTAFD